MSFEKPRPSGIDPKESLVFEQSLAAPEQAMSKAKEDKEYYEKIIRAIRGE